jgi:adenylate kinase
MNIVLFGAPGSGKGTHSNLIAQKFGYIHLSTGDILRGEMAAKSALGLEAEKYVSKGALVPDDLIINMLEKKIDENKSAKGVIFDGFPRTIVQAEELETMLKKHGKKINVMIEIFVEDETLFNRLVLRGKESGRSDDTPETIHKRLAVYHEQTAPVKEFYKRTNRYQSVDNNGSVEECFEQVCKLISQ